VARLEAEHDNVRAALAWSQGAPDAAETMLRLTGAPGWFWYWRGHLGEGRRWVVAALVKGAAIARALGDGWSLAHSLMNQALMAFRHGALDLAVERYCESLAALRGDSDRWFVSRSLQGLASVEWARGDGLRGGPPMGRR
jgi:hypothetical protein